MVPHSPQTLILSPTSTTSLGSKAPAAYRTWCLTPHKPLFLRPEAPRPKVRMGRRTHRRGALSPTNPCSFVRKHHIPRSGWADAGTDVVLHPPQTLVFSSGSTTSPGQDGPTPALTWCFTPRNPLFLRFLCTKSLALFGAPTLRTWCKDSRKTLFLRFLCTKSLALFGAPTLRTWCKDSRKTLFLRFLCTKSLALFGASTLRTWCKDSRKNLFLRFLCTKSPAQDEPPPLLTWCSIPRNPLFLRRGAPRPSPRM